MVGTKIHSARDVYTLLKPSPSNMEIGYVVYLDSFYEIASVDTVQGDEDQVLFDLQAIVSRCFALKVSKVVLAHTHPYGEMARFSDRDLAADSLSKKHLRTYGILLMDSVVMDWYSYDSVRNRARS